MSLSDSMRNHLSTIHEAAKPQGFTYLNINSPMSKALVSQGHLEANANATDPADPRKVAVRLTEQGIAALGGAAPAASPFGSAVAGAPVETAETGQEASQDEAVADAAKTKGGKGSRGPRVVPVVHASGHRIAALPPATPRGRGIGPRAETYPFSTLGAPDQTGYDSFFVAATAEMPAPWRTLQGTVSSANKRFREKGDGREFQIRQVTQDEEFGIAGARIFRVK